METSFPLCVAEVILETPELEKGGAYLLQFGSGSGGTGDKEESCVMSKGSVSIEKGQELLEIVFLA